MKNELAINGGPRARESAWPTWPGYAEDEIAAAEEVLKSGQVNYWTGEQGKEFEREFANHTNRRHAVAVCNGSVALELALHSLGIGGGDEVIVPCRSFIASASSVVLVGARPVFSDIDLISQVVTVNTLEQVVTEKTRAIIVVHLAGWPCEMEDIMSFAKEKNLHVIEDCAQAHGASIYGKPVGSFGDIAAFSFCQDKIMTTGGEGGMLVMDNEACWKKAWEYKDHGKDYESMHADKHEPGFRWVHKTFGTNWRLTELQSAIGRLQLKKLSLWNQQRKSNAEYLYEGLKDTHGIMINMPGDHINHGWYKFYAFIDKDLLYEDWARDQIVDAINAEGIPCMAGSCGEIYLEDSFQKAGYIPAERFTNAKLLADTSIMFQIHPTMTTNELADTILAVKKVMAAGIKDDK